MKKILSPDLLNGELKIIRRSISILLDEVSHNKSHASLQNHPFLNEISKLLEGTVLNITCIESLLHY